MKEVNLNPLAKLNLSAKTVNENIDTDENTGADFLFDDETAETEGTDGFVRTQSTAAPKQPATTRRIALQKEQAGQLPITVSPQPFVYVSQKNIFLSGLSGDSDDASVEELEAQKQAEMEALQAEIDAATEAYKQTAEKLNNYLEGVNENINEYDKQLTDIDSQIIDIDSEINEYHNHISDIDEKVGDTDSAIAEKDADIAKKDTEIGQVSSRINSIENEISSISSNIATLQSQLNAIPESTGDEATDSANAAQRNALQNQISQLESQKAEKERKKLDYEGKLADIEGAKAVIEGEKADLEGRKADLEGQKAEMEGKIIELEMQKNELETQKQPIEQEKAVLEEQKASIEAKIEENENSENKKLMDEGPAKLKEIEEKYDKLIEEAKNKENKPDIDDGVTLPDGDTDDDVTPPDNDNDTPDVPGGGLIDPDVPIEPVNPVLPEDGEDDEVTPPDDGADDGVTPPAGEAEDENKPDIDDGVTLPDGDTDDDVTPPDNDNDTPDVPGGGLIDPDVPIEPVNPVLPEDGEDDEVTPPDDGADDGVTPPAGEAEDENTFTPEIADKVDYSIEQVRARDLDDIVEKAGDTMHTEFGMDSSGNIVFQEKETEAVYDEILKRLKLELNNYNAYGNTDVLGAMGGEEMLNDIVQASWISAYNKFDSSKKNDTEAFVNEVLNNASAITNRIAENPELKEVYTQHSSYADKTLTDGLKHYNKNTTYGNDELINYGGQVSVYEDGTVHIDYTKDDRDYQSTMNELLERLIAKYSNVDPEYITDIFRQSQKNALQTLQSNKYDCPYGTGNNNGRVEDRGKNWGGRDNRKGDDSNIHMDELVQITLYNFDKNLYAGVAKDGDAAVNNANGEQTQIPKVEADAPVVDETIKEAAQKTEYSIDNVITRDFDDIVEKAGDTMHTEFGMDSSGNIVFQEKETTAVFDEIVKRLKLELNNYNAYGNTDVLGALGGDAVLERLVQSAWISAYNTFNSSTSNNTEKFVDTVFKNLKTMMDRIQSNTDLIDVFTEHTAYADKTLTDGLKHYNKNTTYGNDELINYGGQVSVYEDGTVHIDYTKDDRDYQSTMNELLERLIAKYSNVDPEYITDIFRQSQKNALQTLQSNKYDCPYGTGNNNGRVEDRGKNWGGRDNRKGDDFKIHMDELVQITLYNFDKLLYNMLLGSGSSSSVSSQQSSGGGGGGGGSGYITDAQPGETIDGASKKPQNFHNTYAQFRRIIQ